MQKLLDTKEAAVMLGLSRRTLENWRNGEKNTGPAFIRLSSRCIRYNVDDINNWIASQTES